MIFHINPKLLFSVICQVISLSTYLLTLLQCIGCRWTNRRSLSSMVFFYRNCIFSIFAIDGRRNWIRWNKRQKISGSNVECNGSHPQQKRRCWKVEIISCTWKITITFQYGNRISKWCIFIFLFAKKLYLCFWKCFILLYQTQLNKGNPWEL